MNPYIIPWMDDDLEVFRDTVVRFIETEMVPHDARWREVRNGIRQYGDAIAAAAGSQGRLLTEEEFHRLHDQFMPEPIPVTLRGYGIVRLRMAHRVYPYVGVDFGGGANAIFEPRTMLCTYSD